jgi:hypothetical protein
MKRIIRQLEPRLMENQVIRRTHVNLVDMLEARKYGRKAKRFRNFDELREYTHATGKYFPINKAKEGGLLKYLLRNMQGLVATSREGK